MSTEDLTSYIPGYDDYCESAKVPYEDYKNLEDKVEIYEKALEKICMAVDENCNNDKKVQFIKAIIEDMKEALNEC